jgi:RimJ/RimL family protein N-acetyltransferase
VEIPRHAAYIVGKQVVLRPLIEPDYLTLFSWRNDAEWLYLWSHPRRLVSYVEFVSTLEKSLHTDVDIWLLIIEKESKEPLGFVYSYDTKTWDCHTFLTMFIASPFRGKSVGLEAGALFIQYLMDYFPLKKVYADVFEFNSISQSFVKDYGFVEEGYFPSHRYYQGKFWGMYRLALYREKWDEIKAPIFEKFN